MELPVKKTPHANRTYGSRVMSFSIILLASVLMAFMASVNRALMSLLTSLETQHYLVESFIFDDRQYEHYESNMKTPITHVMCHVSDNCST